MLRQPNATNFTPQFNAEDTTGKLQVYNPIRQEYKDVTSDEELSDVAFTGDYDDLNNKPDIPAAAPVQSVNGRTGDVIGLAENSDLNTEITNRQNADIDLQDQIDGIEDTIQSYKEITYTSGATGWTSNRNYEEAGLAGKSYQVIYKGNKSDNPPDGGSSYPNRGFQFLSDTPTPNIVFNPTGGFTLGVNFAASEGDVFIIQGVGIRQAPESLQLIYDTELASGVIVLPDTVFQTNKTIDVDSGIITGERNLSDYYKVVPGSSITLSSSDGGSYFNNVGFYDIDRVKAAARVGTGSTTAPVTYTIPANVHYVIFYIGNQTTSTRYKIKVDFGTIEAEGIEDEKAAYDFTPITELLPIAGRGTLKYTTIPAPASAQFNKSIGADSSIIDEGGFDLTDFIFVKPGTKIFLKSGGDSYSNIVGIYDEDKVPLGSRLGSAVVTVDSEYTLPSTAHYIVMYRKRLSSGAVYNFTLSYVPGYTPDIEPTNMSAIYTEDGGVLNIDDIYERFNNTSNDSIFGKKGAVLQDSIGVATTAGNTESTVYWGRLKNKYNLEVYVNAISGTKISFNNDLPERISFSDPVRWESLNSLFEPDFILVAGGTNDFGSTNSAPTVLGTYADARPTSVVSGTTFYSALKYLMYNLTLRYPNTRIIFMTPIARADYGLSMNRSGVGRLRDYRDAIIQVAPDYGVMVIDMFSKSGLTYHNMNTTEFAPDGLHPNQHGMIPYTQTVDAEIKDLFKTY